MKTEIFTFEATNYTIFIGQNAQENTEIVTNASQHDIWFHVENSPSCHVLLKVLDKSKLPIQVLKRCAYLCKVNSKAKYEKTSQIIYTRVCNVTPTHIPGKVYSLGCKVLRI
jgi:predicted ribosome quality control (RQC) complex YloA/Tae2 family protein